MEEEIKLFHKMLPASPLQRSVSVESTQLPFLTLSLLPLPGTPHPHTALQSQAATSWVSPAGGFGYLEGVSLWLSLWGSIPLLPQPTVVPSVMADSKSASGSFLLSPCSSMPHPEVPQPSARSALVRRLAFHNCAAKTQSWPTPKVNHVLPIGQALGDPPLRFGWILRNPRHEDVCVPGTRTQEGRAAAIGGASPVPLNPWWGSDPL